MKFIKFISAAISLCLVGGTITTENIFLSDYPIIADAAKNTYGDLTYAVYSTSHRISIISCDESATEVDIPAEIDGVPVTVIDDSTFWGCSDLKSVTIPNSIVKLGDHAFCWCESLTSITIPDSVTSIGWGAFDHSGLKSVTIPNGVTCIERETFYRCFDLTSVTIPKSVTSIEDKAFDKCDSLTDVYFTGTEDEWNAITIDTNNTNLTNAVIHYNYVIKTTTTSTTVTTTTAAKVTTTSTITKKPNITSILGDLDNDGIINAIDASLVLTAYASAATGGDYGLTDAQKHSADVNSDGSIDALDASVILSYYAYTATGGTDSIENFIK